MTTNRKYDAIVVGSGANGGIAAKELTERGLEVLVLEAGPGLDERLFQQRDSGFKGIGSLPRIKAGLTGHHIQARASFYSPDKRFLFVNDWKHPYTSSEDFYLWIRSKNVGGRFMSWGRVALRMSDYAFKSASHEGAGVDWPIGYNDLVPYYELVEKFLGLVGTEDHIPFVPDGIYTRKAGLAKLEQRFKQQVESKWPERKVIPWRYVVKEATPVDPNAQKRTSSPLVAAAKTGRFELRTNAIVKQIDIDSKSGMATGVTYINALDRSVHQAHANIVMLCASTIESIRLLFNSACAKHPDGVGNSSGLLGRYFMDQVPSLVFGTVPGSYGGELVDGTTPEDSYGGVYIPRFQNLASTTHPTFKGGYNIQGIVGRAMVPKDHESVFGFMGHGEMLPYYENRVVLNRKKKDAWGIPVPDVRIKLMENEKHLVQSQLETTKEMVRENGYAVDFAMNILRLEDNGKLLPKANWFERMMFRMNWRKSMALGAAIHECGGARMGNDPTTSVLNPVNQCWDAKNIFVTDSSCFPTNGSCGPTLTTMALTVRACEYIANEYGHSKDLAAE
jgi:choline dehydrogenase-like flavoprotein